MRLSKMKPPQEPSVSTPKATKKLSAKKKATKPKKLLGISAKGQAHKMTQDCSTGLLNEHDVLMADMADVDDTAMRRKSMAFAIKHGMSKEGAARLFGFSK